MGHTDSWNTSALKPLSINEAFLGKKTKSAKYRKYEKQLLRTLPDVEIPDGLLEVRLIVYYSSKLSDLDNAAKPFIDVLCKRYGFDDRYIRKLRMSKFIVPKGKEHIAFSIRPYKEPEHDMSKQRETTTDIVAVMSGTPTESTLWELECAYRDEGATGIGSHYVIDASGDTSKHVPADNHGNVHEDYNETAVFIEVMGEKAELMTPEQRAALSGAVYYLETKYPDAEYLPLHYGE